MPCWMVPSIAAEYWRVSVERVFELINQGAVPVCTENGFTFVDVLPDPSRSAPTPEQNIATAMALFESTSVNEPAAAGIDIYIDPGGAKANVIYEVLAALSALNVACGGNGLVYRSDGMFVISAGGANL